MVRPNAIPGVNGLSVQTRAVGPVRADALRFRFGISPQNRSQATRALVLLALLLTLALLSLLALSATRLTWLGLLVQLCLRLGSQGQLLGWLRGALLGLLASLLSALRLLGSL